MTKTEVLLNYNQAVQQASKLEDVARKMEKLASEKMEGTVGTLKNAWQSDSSSQYYNKVAKVQGDIRTTARKIRTIAKSIRTTAQAVKQAELRSIEIAQARSYR